MDPLSLTGVSLVVLLFAAVSRRAERSPVTPPMFFVAAGLILGGEGLAWIDVDVDHIAIHVLAEFTLVLVLFTDATRIDLACLRREASLPLRMLTIGLPATVGLGAAAAIALLPGFDWPDALLLAAILAPTDAALGQAVVTNPAIPLRIRQSLNVESGLNDGLALPLVLVLASMAGVHEATLGTDGWLRVALLAVTLGPLAGLAVGGFGGQVIAWGIGKGWINGPFERISGLALALLAFASAESIGGNGFIASFVAGLTLGTASRPVCESLFEFGEAEGQLLTLLVFMAFGATMVPEALHHATPEILLYVALSLTVVRMGPVALSLVGTGLRSQSVAFLGWFGPRGLASILFGLLVLGEGTSPALMATVTLTVFCSTLLHGATAYPLARRYGRFTERIASHHPEHDEAMPLPVRIKHSHT